MYSILYILYIIYYNNVHIHVANSSNKNFILYHIVEYLNVRQVGNCAFQRYIVFDVLHTYSLHEAITL